MTREDIERALNEFYAKVTYARRDYLTGKEEVDFALDMVRKAWDECEGIVRNHPGGANTWLMCKSIRAAKP